MTNDPTKHFSAGASHYDQEAKKYYDAFNEDHSVQINKLIAKILQERDVKTVLDFTCGTGSQVFWLTNQGFEVVGIDINNSMLAVAREKAKKKHLSIRLEQGDMRTVQVGKFDAAITIFNAIGHLTQEDFEKAIQNIHSNLHADGLYIFDIFNLSYLLHEDNITKLTIDWQKKTGDVIAREIQYSTITQEGVLASYDIYHEQIGANKPHISTAFQTLQVYSAEQLREILQKNGFSTLHQCDIDGSSVCENTTERMLTIAKKL